MNPYLEKIYIQITADLAKSMFEILHNYPGHEPEVARLMTAQLGSFIGVTAKDPAQALIFYANRLAHFDFETVRRDYFANTLGVQNTTPAKVIPAGMVPAREPAEVYDIGRSNPVCPDPGQDPRAKKPD